MTKIYNKLEIRETRRLLRNNMTKAEVILWHELRNRNITGQRFLRQYSVGSYVLDFYCPGIKLAIEVDGPIHLVKSERIRDKERQESIETLNIRFLRFTNSEIYNDLNNVLRKIKQTIKKLLIQPRNIKISPL